MKHFKIRRQNTTRIFLVVSLHFVFLNFLLIVFRSGSYSNYVIEQIAFISLVSLLVIIFLPIEFFQFKKLGSDVKHLLWISTLLFTIFGLVVPGAIDRSRSVFVLQWVHESNGRLATGQLLEEIKSQVGIEDQDAILQRLSEQTARGAIGLDADGHYVITNLGKTILFTSDAIAFLYNLQGFNRNKISLQ